MKLANRGKPDSVVFMARTRKPVEAEIQSPVDEYEPSTELKQTDLAEGELETVEECLRRHEETEDVKISKSSGASQSDASPEGKDAGAEDRPRQHGTQTSVIGPQAVANHRMRNRKHA